MAWPWSVPTLPEDCFIEYVGLTLGSQVESINGTRSIKARLTVRGYKDMQATLMQTFAGTTARWGHRIVNSISVEHN